MTRTISSRFFWPGGIDFIRFANVRKENTGAKVGISGLDNVKNNQSQLVLGGTWKHLWGSSGYTFQTLSTNLNRYFTDVDDSLGNKTYRNESTEGEYNARIDASFSFSKDHQLAFGGGSKLVLIDHDLFVKADTSRWANRQTGAGVFPQLASNRRISSYKLWAYFQYTRWFSNQLTATGFADRLL